MTRRSLLCSSAIVPLALGLGGCAQRQNGSPVRATSIVTGGKILTMDPARPVAEAMAIHDERILAVGSNDDINALASSSTQRFDARGMTVLPGFIDAHSHPLFAREVVGVNVDLRRIEDVKKALAEKAAQTPAGTWILGVMYDDTRFEDGRPLTLADIDQVVRDRPVFVSHRGGHTAVVNSKAFEVAGITFATADPAGGMFYRENGRFTGKVAELATMPFYKSGVWPVIDRSIRQKAATLSSKKMAAAGLTSTTDAEAGVDNLIAYQDARAAGELYFRLSYMPIGTSDAYKTLKLAGVRSGFGDDMIRIGAVKFLADGSASERTMRMSTPYAGRPHDYGILTMTQEEIDAAVDDAVAHDFRVGIHANGDIAIDMVLKSYERVLKGRSGPNPRHRIEHCSLINDQLLARIKAAGVIPTPFYTYVYYHGKKWAEYGEEKMESMFAHRSFQDAGIPVAPASDYVAGPFEPLMAIQSMVTRKDMNGHVWGARQRISVSEALQICTMNGAYASFEEGIKGSLTAGKLADYVILEKDPHEVDPDSIKDIKVVRTVLGGRATYEA